MVRGKHIHRRQAERRIHGVAFLVLEIDHQPLRRIVVALDLTETPTAMDHVSAWLHGLEFSFGRLEGRVFGNESGDSFGSHNCESDGLNGRVERRMIYLVKQCVERVRHG